MTSYRELSAQPEFPVCAFCHFFQQWFTEEGSLCINSCC